MGTGRFSHALMMPRLILLTSNAWRVPSFLTTRMGWTSIVSYVVKRPAAAMHSRRRRMVRSSSAERESMTLLSVQLQYKQRIVFSLPPYFGCILFRGHHISICHYNTVRPICKGFEGKRRALFARSHPQNLAAGAKTPRRPRGAYGARSAR